MRRLRIGTRASRLALWQANHVKQALLAAHDNLSVQLVEMVSEGDRNLDVALLEIGGKSLFLKELEAALLQGDIDVAVHSMKDVSVQLPDGLQIGAICARADPHDALVSTRYPSLAALPPAARVGTCSLRRQSQLAAAYPHIELVNLRGNVDTRLRRLARGDFAAIVLAAAGLIRLELAAQIAERIALDVCLPAVGQAAVGIECRIDDRQTHALIRPLADAAATCRVAAERAVNRSLGGGCHLPIAAYAELHRDELYLRARVATLDGTRLLHAEQRAARADAEQLGAAVAEQLRQQGAADILDAIYRDAGHAPPVEA